MAILVDTSVVARALDSANPHYATCNALIAPNVSASLRLRLCDQVLYEFWSVATRPRQNNGFGMSVTEADAAVERFLAVLVPLANPPDLFARWRSLVVKFDVQGKTGHDARLVALMDAYGMREICTLNPVHFHRYGHIRCVSPAALLAP